MSPPGTEAGRLLDASALARYDALALHVRRGMGDRPGERRYPGRPQPSGIEVESWSAYAPGDDLRHLDWNAAGRLGTLVTRRYTAEREVLFDILVDASASMGVPAADRKFAVACELAMALAYVALAAGDAVRMGLLSGDHVRLSPVRRQRASAVRVAQFLTTGAPAGALVFGSALAELARRHRRPGAAVIVSDLMMEPPEIERGLHALRARRSEVLLLQVIGRSELEPDFTQGVLRDVESGLTRPVMLTPDTRARYAAVLDAHLTAIETVAARAGVTYAGMVTDAAVAHFVTAELGRLGVVRRR